MLQTSNNLQYIVVLTHIFLNAVSDLIVTEIMVRLP